MAAAADAARDAVGIGWRPELSLGIMAHLDHIDVLEVIADDLFAAPRKQLAALQTLARQVPLVLHGVSLGLASAEPVEPRRLDAMARVVGALQPKFWSEHLAFVRGGGLEVGHLTAPPRSLATIDGTRRNVELAARVVGAPPLLENVATLVDPPGSTFTEPDWTRHALSESRAGWLLDLNNLHSNAVNFGFDALAALDHVGSARVRAVHLAGGRWIRAPGGGRRLLDDHRHDVPDAVYDLLTELARRAEQPLTVILERDGDYPAFEQLLAQLERAREALARGRQTAPKRSGVVLEPGTGSAPGVGSGPGSSGLENGTSDVAPREAAAAGAREPPTRRESVSKASRESAAALEAYLVQLHVDADARRRFLGDPRGEAERRGLDAEAVTALTRVDRVGLELAADSVATKHPAPAARAAAPLPRGIEWGRALWQRRGHLLRARW